MHRLTEPDVDLARQLVIEFHRLTTPDRVLQTLIGDPNVHWLAAFIDNRPVGHLVAYELETIGGLSMLFIHMLEVAPDQRRTRVGLTLLEAAKHVCASRGIGSMWLTTSKGNKAALSLYRQAGGRVSKARRVVEWTVSQ